MPAVPGSVLEQVRKDRERLTKPRFKDFDVPGYSALRVRYGVLPYKRTLELAQEAYDPARDGVDPADTHIWEAAEALMDCCKGFLVKVDDTWVTWEEDGQPVRYDSTLVKALSITLPANAQPRDVVYELFGGLATEGTDRALMTHYFDVIAWMDNTHAEATAELVGNSNGAE